MTTSPNNWKSITDYNPKDLPFYVLLLSAPLLLTLWRYLGDSKHFKAYFPQLANSPQGDIQATILQFAAFFVLMLVIPMAYCLLFWRRSPKTLGLGPGDVKAGIRFVLIFIPIVALSAWIGAADPAVRLEYPLAKGLYQLPNQLITYELAYFLLFYIAWEFYFRGFLLFGLKDRFGGLNAILIQTISSCLVHIDKPFAEIMGSILAGVVLGYIALRTRSIWYVLLIHALLGVLTDVFVLATAAGWHTDLY